MALINGSEKKLSEMKVIFIHGDQLNYLPNLRKLLCVTQFGSVVVCFLLIGNCQEVSTFLLSVHRRGKFQNKT